MYAAAAVMIFAAAAIAAIGMKAPPAQTEKLVIEVNEDGTVPLAYVQQLMDRGDEIFVYFWDPDCPFCAKVDPYLKPLGAQLDNFYIINVVEHPEAKKIYKIQGTPTVAHFKNRLMINRLDGARMEDTYREFLGQEVPGA